jgi:hypothetical protein
MRRARHGSRSIARAVCALALAVSGIGLAQEGKPKTPMHTPSLGNSGVSSVSLTTEVRTALEELLGRLRAHLRDAGQAVDLHCEAPRVWAYSGKVEAAAAWIGRQVRRMGFAFSSEGQLTNFYGFTAITNDAKHVSDVMVGGLIEGGPAIIAFLQRCHPNEF